MSRIKKMVWSSATAIAAAAALTVAVPVGSAYAINEVTCRDGAGYLVVEGKNEFGQPFKDCWANAGKTGNHYWPSVWVTRITTGNNDVIYYDVNGAKVSLNRWTVYQPKNAAHIKEIEIR